MLKKLVATFVSFIFLVTPVIAAEKGEVKDNATQTKKEKKVEKPKQPETKKTVEKKAGNVTTKTKKKVEGC